MKTKVNKTTHTIVSPQSVSTNEIANSVPSTSNLNDEQISPKHTRPKTKSKAKSTQKQKRRRSSSSSNSSSSSCEDGIDPAIEKKLKQSALRNNLTHENVKNILHKVVRNDHVLAIVKLKEEELEQHEKAKKLMKLEHDDDEDGPAALPKLTRAKAKALNKQPLPLAPLKSSPPDSDVVALISEELRSDDDDEEYQPGDDDIETDDDFNTTASDIDSQPRTPQTPSSHIEQDEEMTPRTTYTTDGLFKVPRARNESTTSQSEHEYIIAQRTRSKVSLAETPIEAIESNFKPPDVPIGFYGNTDLDPDDLPWSEFMLNYRFDKAPDHEEDEDGDPDYIVADKAPVDKEELRQPKVPKKELEDLLVAHEINASDNNWWNDFLSIEFGENSNDMPNTDLTTPVKNDVCSAEIEPDKQATSAIFPNATANHQSTHSIQLSTDSALPTSPPFFDLLRYTSPMEINGPYEQRSCTSQSNSAQIVDATKHVSATFATNGTETYPKAGPSFNLSSAKEPSTLQYVPVLETNASPINSMPSNSTNAARQFIFLLPAPTGQATMALTGSPSTPTVNTQNGLPLNTLNRQIEAGGLPPRTGTSKRTRFKKNRFRELENLDPQHIDARKAFNPAARGFTGEQQLMLEQQLRMHVQLTAQNFMQTYGHPEHYARAYKFKRFLMDLHEINNSNNRIANLRPALALIAEWESELSVDSIENTELIQHIQSELKKLRSNVRYEMRFHERWLKKVCHSTVFVYSTLLPATPFRFETKKISEYLPSEDYLISFGLERYFAELTEKMQRYKLLKPKPVSLATVCRYISANFCYLRSAKSLYDYVRLRRAESEIINPIKYYFVHKKAPTHDLQLIPFDENCMIEPVKRTLPELPRQFAKYVEKLVGVEHDKFLSNFVATDAKLESSTKHCAVVTSSSSKPFNYRSKAFVEDETPANSNRIDDGHEKSFSIEVICRNTTTASHPPCHCHYCHHHHHDCETSCSVFDLSASNSLNCSRCTVICDNNDLNISRHFNKGIGKGQTLLTSYFSVLKKKTTPSPISPVPLPPSSPADANFANDECGDTDQVIVETYTKHWAKADSINWCRVKILRKYLHLSYRKRRHRQQLRYRLEQIIRKSKRVYAKRWRLYRRQPLLLFTFLCFDTYHMYTNELMKMNGLNAPAGRRPSTAAANRSTPIDVVAANRRVQKIANDISDEVNAKRLTKGNRTAENARMMLLYENQQESSEKDFIFAQHFFDRVEETFATENNHQKINEFLNILKCFDNSKENGVDLYLKLERLFAPDHLELTDLFLNFLLPRDAIEIGKFMEHFLATNMWKFINRLNLFYQKQPAQLRKVFACLKELAEEDDVKVEKIRNKIVPLLKGNQLLVDWFLQCLGNETGENSNTKDEYETISFRKAADTVDDDTEAYEHIPQSEIFPDPNDNPCHIRYMNGRLFYGNRLSFPAKLSFSTINSNATDIDRGGCAASKPTMCPKMKQHENEKESGPSTANVSYRCVHDIKEFGNMKVKSRNQMEIDQMDNSTAEEGDDSEDDQQVVDVKLSNTLDDKPSTDKVSDTVSTHLLCDDKMLKAHGIRLNPSAHSSMNYNNVEMLNMLKPTLDCIVDGHRECKLSPKKQAHKTSSATTQAKPPRKYSPNAKKTNGTNQASPNRKNLSPPSLHMQHAQLSAGKLACDSPAIQTAKKLKRILESSPPDDDKIDNTPTAATSTTATLKRNLPTTSNLTNKVRRINRTSTSTVEHTPVTTLKVKSTKITAEKIDDNQQSSFDRKVPISVAEMGRCNEPDANTPKKRDTVDKLAETPITWSRDEDRLLLEHIKDGLESNHELITQITHEFPTKTAKNIEERIDFLIDFLTKLRNIT